MYSHSPLLQAFFQNVERTPNKVAIIVNGQEVTYLHLAEKSRKAASFLVGI